MLCVDDYCTIRPSTWSYVDYAQTAQSTDVETQWCSENFFQFHLLHFGDILLDVQRLFEKRPHRITFREITCKLLKFLVGLNGAADV